MIPEYKTAPVVVGGVYRRKLLAVDKEGGPLYEYALCASAEQRTDGKLTGILLRAGRMSVSVTEGQETMAGWDLMSRPVLLDEPVCSDAPPERDPFARTPRPPGARV